MEDITYLISFDEVSSGEANILASELKEAILNSSSDVRVEQTRDNSNTMDLGVTLAVILGSAAVTAIARGIANWAQFHREVKLNIKNKNGTVIAEKLTSSDALRIVELMTKSQDSNE